MLVNFVRVSALAVLNSAKPCLIFAQSPCRGGRRLLGSPVDGDGGGGGGGASGFQTLTLSLTRPLTLSLHLSLSWCRGGRPVPDLPVLRHHRSAGLPQPLSSLSCCGFGVGVPRAPSPSCPSFCVFAGNVRGFGPLLPPFFLLFLGHLPIQLTSPV